ncbi:unnamed protein product [Sympodiomycopsis kandeliae]
MMDASSSTNPSASVGMQFFPDSALTKRKSSVAVAADPNNQLRDGITPREFSRTDSRGQYRQEALPPDEIQAGLASRGMQIRMAIEKGLQNQHGLMNSNREIFSRTYSVPALDRRNELQPFSNVPVEHDMPFWGASTVREEQEQQQQQQQQQSPSKGKKRKDDDDGDQVAFGANENVDPDDVLGNFMSDDEGDDDAGQDVAMQEIQPVQLPETSGRQTLALPKRQFKQVQTMPVSSTTLANHLNSAGNTSRRIHGDNSAKNEYERDPRWQGWDFGKYASRETGF